MSSTNIPVIPISDEGINEIRYSEAVVPLLINRTSKREMAEDDSWGRKADEWLAYIATLRQ